MAQEITELVGKPITQSREEIDHGIKEAKAIIDISHGFFDDRVLH